MKTRNKRATEAFMYNQQTSHGEISIVSIRVIGLEPWSLIYLYSS